MRISDWSSDVCSSDLFSQGCNWDQLTVVVLPYVPIGTHLQESLEVLHENGAQLIAPAAGVDGWPVTGTPHALGGNFHDELFDALCAALAWNAEIPPSEYRSEEHTSELQSLMRTSYAVFC